MNRSGRRPLPPLPPDRRVILRVIAAGQAVVGVLWLARGVAESSWLSALAGAGFVLVALGTTYEIRRRSDPARTAGWGRQRRADGSDAQRRLHTWRGGSANQSDAGTPAADEDAASRS